MPDLKNGFTLIELLVVISIISIMSIFAFVNFKDYAAEQVTPKAAGQIQSLIKLAQSNATSSTICTSSVASTSWSLEFLNATTIKLDCYNNTTKYPQKTYTLQNASMEILCSSVSGSNLIPITFTFTSGTGALAVTNGTPPSPSCLTSPSFLFKITNTLNPAVGIKEFKVSKGGAIDVQ